MKLILHPGHGKCGSSSIQTFLYSKISELNKLGIYLPDPNFRFSFEIEKSSLEKQTPLWYFKRLMDEDNMESFEERLNQVLEKAHKSNCKMILISAENLGNIRGITKGRKIHEILASHFDQKMVIFYIRRQDDYLVSSWQQWGHKKGETLKEHIDKALAEHEPDFLGRVRFFEEIYGEESITVVPLHNQALIKGNLIDDFCFRSQLSISEESNLQIQTSKANKSLNPYLCDILSRISSIYTDPHDNSIKKLLTSYVDTEKLLFLNDPKILSQEQRNRILKEFDDDNLILSKKYFDCLTSDDFANKKLDVEDKIHQTLDDEIEGLKDIISIQMEIIIKLLKEQQQKDNPPSKKLNIKREIKQLIKKVFKNKI